MADAAVGPGDRVVEVGAGLGSLTVALADAGPARVLALEVDRRLIPPLEEVTTGLPAVEVRCADATRFGWARELRGAGWLVCANLPYNVSVPLVMTVLESAPAVERIVVMVQREVGERLAAEPGRPGFGAVSLRVAYRADAAVVRRVPPEVFWPRPAVASVVVRLVRRASPPVEVDEARLWRVVDAGFAERRKTMRNALRRIGVEDPDGVLRAAGLEPSVRAEELSLAAFAAIAGRIDP